ncbi:hypothetical protein F0726_02773 [Acidithiobacillus caldus]|nr:hypothetical protein F0726_02773 [Acidithiobacillus caldus]
MIRVAHQHVIEGVALTALRLQARQDSGSRGAQRLYSSDAFCSFSVVEMAREACRGVLGQKLLKNLLLERLQFGVIGAKGESGNFAHIKIRADDGPLVGQALLPELGRRLVQAVEQVLVPDALHRPEIALPRASLTVRAHVTHGSGELSRRDLGLF